MSNRTTPEYITDVKKNQVFVFGSNESGIHGGGAARLAFDKFGAIWGQLEGLQGNSYAIPSKSKGITRTLTLEEIKPYVDRFVDFAKDNPGLTFFVTEIGCGLAGLTPRQVAPLFENCKELPNVCLPKRFWEVLL